MNHRYPQALEAERALLGNLLIDPERLGAVADDLQPHQFYREPHGQIWQWMVDAHRAGRHVSDFALQQHVSASPTTCGGLAYVQRLTENVPYTVNLPYYVNLIRDTATRRAALAELEALQAALYDTSTPLTDSLASVETKVRAVADQALGADAEWADAAELADRTYGAIAERYAARQRGETIGIGTSITALDRVAGTLRPGQLVIVAGRPGMGKTSLALGMALHAAQAGKRVGFVSREMLGTELTERCLSMLSGIPGEVLRDALLDDDPTNLDSRWRKTSEQKFRELEAACQRFSRLPFHVAERATTVSEIRAAAKRLAARHGGLDLLVVDYLQRVKGHGETSAERIGSVAVGCKSLAKDDLKIPVVLLSQFNRSADGESSPSAAATKGSGDIEQEADKIFSPIRFSEIDQEADPTEACINISKNRGGQTGRVPARWDGSRTRYLDADDVPAVRRVS